MTRETHERQRAMTFVIAQQARGMQHERSTILATLEARTLVEAWAKAGAILRRRAQIGDEARKVSRGTCAPDVA